MTRFLRKRLGAAGVLAAFSVVAAGAVLPTQPASAAITPGAVQAARQKALLTHGAPSTSALVAKDGRTHAAGWASWRGRSVPVVVDYLGSRSWASMQTQTWAPQRWPGDDHLVVWSMPTLPSDGTGNLVDGAAGKYNHVFKTIAEQLVAGGEGYSVIRPAWEMTGDWFKWNGLNDPASYRAYWRQIVTTMRAVPGAHFVFDWNIADTTNDPRPMYPGDDVVDIIGMDIYDSSYAWSYPATDYVKTWNYHLTKPYGLNWLADFATAHNKRLSLPEWGLVQRCDAHGGGDNPKFVENIYNWVRTHNVAYEAYFDDDDNECKRFTLRTADFPNGAAAYKRLFGASTATPAPTTAAPTPAPTTAAPTPAPTPAAPTPAPTPAAPTPAPTTAAPVPTTPAPTMAAPAPTTAAPAPTTAAPAPTAPAPTTAAPTASPTKAPEASPTTSPKPRGRFGGKVRSISRDILPVLTSTPIGARFDAALRAVVTNAQVEAPMTLSAPAPAGGTPGTAAAASFSAPDASPTGPSAEATAVVRTLVWAWLVLTGQLR